MVISFILYVGFCVALLGIVPYNQLNVFDPLSVATEKRGMKWLQITVHLAAIAGLTSVILINLMAQPRILYTMANDGLIPEIFAKIYEEKNDDKKDREGGKNEDEEKKRTGRRTPHVATIFTGVICAIAAGLLSLDFLSELASLETLFPYLFVHF
ncbi:unnamed protein product, partial [Didymodactylos carnosus]